MNDHPHQPDSASHPPVDRTTGEPLDMLPLTPVTAATPWHGASPAARPPIVDADGMLAEERPCLGCGYNLRGLSTEGMCAECGMPIERSLRGNMLRYSSPNYLRHLHSGVWILLVGLAAHIVLAIVVSALGIFLMASGSASAIALVETLSNVASTTLGLVMLVGWWLFSSPDPGVVGTDTGDIPRRIIRITVVVQAVASLVVSAMSILTPAAIIAGVGSAVFWTISSVATIAWIAQFFAAMLYLRWLAPRLPNQRVFDRAKLLMWLGPVLMILSCLIIPLLVAMVLYGMMLNWVRVDLKRIRMGNRPATAPLPPEMRRFH